MSNFDETLMKRLTKLEREVERLRVKERPAGGSGVTDHGALTGLADNDHPQYLLTSGKAADADNWTPTLVGWSSTTLVQCTYYKVGNIVFFQAIITGTSNSSSTSFTLPETNVGSEYTGAMGRCVDNGNALTTAGRFSIGQNSNVCNAYTNMASGAWTASGAKRISVYGWIAIN